MAARGPIIGHKKVSLASPKGSPRGSPAECRSPLLKSPLSKGAYVFNGPS